MNDSRIPPKQWESQIELSQGDYSWTEEEIKLLSEKWLAQCRLLYSQRVWPTGEDFNIHYPVEEK